MIDTDTQTFSYIHIWHTEGFYKVFLHDDMCRCNKKFKRLKEAVEYAQNHRRFIIHVHREDGKVVQEIKPKLKALTHFETKAT